MLREPDQTDELRRLAVQLALQLPASVSDAHRVLELTRECLDEFLVEKTETAAARAKRLWRWRPPAPVVVNAAPLPSGPPVFAVLLCCLGVLALAGLAGAIVLRWTGFGAAAANMLAVTAIALLFGRVAALGSAAGAFAITNWAVLPPAWDLAWPTTYELCGLGAYTLAAMIVPWIQARREPLRAASLRVAETPLRVLLRRAA
jgi:hypothetical protein